MNLANGKCFDIRYFTEISIKTNNLKKCQETILNGHPDIFSGSINF